MEDINKAKRVALEGFVVALSLWIGFMEKFVNFGGIQCGLYIIPILIFQDFYGLKFGLFCFFCYDIIKSIFFSKAGILGFVCRVPIVFYMILRKNSPSRILTMMLFDLIGITLYVILKMPFSYIFWKTSTNTESVSIFQIIFKYTIPFNFLSLSFCILVSRIIKLKRIMNYRS